MGRVLHGIEVVEIAEELVEAVKRREVFVEIAQVILAKLAGGVPHRPKSGRDRGRLSRHPIFAPAWPTVVSPVLGGIAP